MPSSAALPLSSAESPHNGGSDDLSRWGLSTMLSEERRESPAFACCSAGIGRWFWVAWESEAEARALSPALASGYEKSADRAEAKAVERLGTGMTRLPAKWASAYIRRGKPASRPPETDRGNEDAGEPRPRSRFGRWAKPPKRPDAAPRLSFLYSAAMREPPDSLGHVAVTRHRIVKQSARKIYVECDPFDEEDWARRSELGEDSTTDVPKARTLTVDRTTLRKEGRFQCGRAHRGKTFYATEEDGIRDVEAALTARYTWCAKLGVRFPCSVETIKAAYRRLARGSHPDTGGNPDDFRTLERAYRDALAYFSQGEDGKNRDIVRF